MAKNTKPLFSTTAQSWAFTIASGATKTGEAVEITDFPPTAHNIATMLLTGATATGTETITVTCQLGFGPSSVRVWGPEHTVSDVDGNATWSLTTTTSKFLANLYAHDWWTLCDAFRIILTCAGAANITGNGVACVQ